MIAGVGLPVPFRAGCDETLIGVLVPADRDYRRVVPYGWRVCRAVELAIRIKLVALYGASTDFRSPKAISPKTYVVRETHKNPLDTVSCRWNAAYIRDLMIEASFSGAVSVATCPTFSISMSWLLSR